MVSEKILEEGRFFNLPYFGGNIHVTYVKRKYFNPRINFSESKKLKESGELQKGEFVYFTDESYPVWEWFRNKKNFSYTFIWDFIPSRSIASTHKKIIKKIHKLKI